MLKHKPPCIRAEYEDRELAANAMPAPGHAMPAPERSMASTEAAVDTRAPSMAGKERYCAESGMAGAWRDREEEDDGEEILLEAVVPKSSRKSGGGFGGVSEMASSSGGEGGPPKKRSRVAAEDASAAVDGVLALLEKLHGAKAKGLITEAVFEGFKEKYSKQLMALMGAAGGGMGD